MNRLPLDKRVQVLAALCEGASIRATCRMAGAAKNTIVKLLADVGDACDEYQFANLRNLRCARVQCDEVWSFCYAKEKNLKKDLRGTMGIGDMWTWTAIDPDSKLIISWHLGKRSRDDAWRFIRDLAERVTSKAVQITTDGFMAYNEPIEMLFPRADHGNEVKVYGRIPFESSDTKYSPMVVTDVIRTSVWGAPDPDYITTAHVERNNLTMRMHNRRFTRLTNAFSKKAQNHQRALALHFMYYNFVKKHGTVKVVGHLDICRSPKLERLTSRMQGGLKRRTLNELADRDRRGNCNDLRHLFAGIPCFYSLDDPPPIGPTASVRVQSDEVWSFCYAKEKNLKKDLSSSPSSLMRMAVLGEGLD